LKIRAYVEQVLSVPLSEQPIQHAIPPLKRQLDQEHPEQLAVYRGNDAIVAKANDQVIEVTCCQGA
jgi:hypothetical protein